MSLITTKSELIQYKIWIRVHDVIFDMYKSLSIDSDKSSSSVAYKTSVTNGK